MIEILLKKNKSEYQQCIIKGHSGFSNKGTDIVCSAVSFLVQSVVYYCLNNDIKISEKDYSAGIVLNKNDYVLLELDELHKKKSDIYDYFFTGLAMLEKTYKKNINIQIVEDIHGS